MKRCKHARTWTTWRNDKNEVVMRRCNDCMECQPLGPSDETDERVAVEIRATALAHATAETGAPSSTYLTDGAECVGWICHAFDSAKVPGQDGEWSGWLAREIHEHKEQS